MGRFIPRLCELARAYGPEAGSAGAQQVGAGRLVPGASRAQPPQEERRRPGLSTEQQAEVHNLEPGARAPQAGCVRGRCPPAAWGRPRVQAGAARPAPEWVCPWCPQVCSHQGHPL